MTDELNQPAFWRQLYSRPGPVLPDTEAGKLDEDDLRAEIRGPSELGESIDETVARLVRQSLSKLGISHGDGAAPGED